MGFATKYLEKHQFLKADISRVPNNLGLLKYIVIIPAYCEPEIFATLNSLCNCTAIEPKIEIFILVNYSETCSDEIKEQNKQLYIDLLRWSENNSNNLSFIPLLAKNLPAKHAGVGLARKILMDSACERFDTFDNPEGIIISLDADTLVPDNYFTELNKQVNNNINHDCFIFNFAHPTSGSAFSEDIYNAIALYEIHLRYYKQILDSIKYPYSQYTIGSCFAVKAKTYVKVGGMSRRKAGEDFYFLHKVYPVARTKFLSQIKLTPSPRPSSRVPFGTGPVINRITGEGKGSLETYHPQSFYDLQFFLNIIPSFYELTTAACQKSIKKLPESIMCFLLKINVFDKIAEIKTNCASEPAFIKRFYNWFDAFIVLKYLNFARDNYFGSMDITDAARVFLNIEEENIFKLLELIREKDN